VCLITPKLLSELGKSGRIPITIDESTMTTVRWHNIPRLSGPLSTVVRCLPTSHG
jgi:hypothetical protein